MSNKNVQSKIKIGAGEDRIAKVFGAFGDECRLKIIRLVGRDHDLCVSDIAEICGISVSAASQQLKILEMREVVKKIRHGQRICFKIRRDNPLTAQMIRIIKV